MYGHLYTASAAAQAPLEPASIEAARRVRIEDEAKRRGVKLTGKNDRAGPCPKCGGTDRFAINIKKQIFNCRGCCVGGDVIDLVQHIDGCTFVEAVEKLSGTPSVARERRDDDEANRTAFALRWWTEASPIKDTLGMLYLQRERGISDLPPDCHDVLRFHPRCVWDKGAQPCIIALLRDAVTDEPTGVQRIAIPAGKLIGRKALGRKKGAAVKLWGDAEITTGLVVGEGIETTLAAATRVQHRGTLLQPAWALVDAPNMAGFPVLAGGCDLTILVDADELKHGRQAGQEAARECAERWADAGREVTVLTPDQLGTDFNDIARVQP